MLVNLSGPLVVAQKRDYRFNNYTTDEGLSQNMVDCIFKDSRGFMWFGTWNGLNRFDGYNFKTYSSQGQGEYSLGNNFIYDIDEDPYGNLWIATAEGLHVYLYSQDKFKIYLHDPTDTLSIRSNKINSILVDDRGDLWIGTDKGIEIASVKGPDGSLEMRYREPESDLLQQNREMIVQCIYKDPSGRIWAGTDRGLALLDQSANVSTMFTFQEDNNYSLSNNSVQAILQDAEGTLWIGCSSGLNRFEPQSNRFYRYFYDPNDNSGIVHNSIEDLILDSDGNLVIGTLGGISVLNKEDDRFYSYSVTSYLPTELNNEFVNCLFADEEGNIWIGTERGGINQFNIHQNEFDYLISSPGIDQSLSSNTVNSVWEDEEALWVGTAGGGLNRIHKKSGWFKHYLYDAALPQSISNDFITSIHRDRSGNLLLGTWGGGINSLSPEQEQEGRFARYFYDPEDEHSLSSNFVSSIVEDRYGLIWIGTFGGLAVYNPENKEFTRAPSDLGGLVIDRIGCLNFDLFSNLWVGTEEGLYFIPYSSGKPFMLDFDRIREYKHSSDFSESLSGDYIISIFDDSKGNLWVGTYGYGMNKLPAESLNEENGYFTHYSESDGLCNNTIYGIQEDHGENLWLSTDNGLSKFDLNSGMFTNFYMVDGLLDNQFYWSASYKSNSDRLYFGSMKGLLSFSPEDIMESGVDPGVVLTDFRVYNQSVGVGEEYFDKVAIDKHISQTDIIILSHKIKEFSIDFSALYYVHPEKVYYAYKMEGFDEDWHYVSSNRRVASYTNLKGGNYTLQVKSSLHEGHFELPPLEIKIKIIPPFWVKFWFILTMVLLLISAVISYNRYRVYFLRKRQKELEELVAKRTAQIRGQKEQLEKQNIEIMQQRDKLVELNKSVQQSNLHQMRFFTHMSHEFKTPLTLIIAPLEQLITEISSRSPHYKTLLLIKRNSQRLLHLVNQLMEVRRIKTGKMDLRASKGDLVIFTENIIQSFYSLAAQKGIIYDFHANPGSIETYFDPDKIENMLYNLLSNAFKYTPEGGQIEVHMSVVKEKVLQAGDVAIVANHDLKPMKNVEYTEILVKDTGYGIEEEELKKIFKRFFKIPVADVPDAQGTGIGLYLTKELIKSHKGQLYINSKINEGTIFTILIPIGSGFLDIDEISEAVLDYQKGIPKLHVDLLSGQIEQQKDPHPESRALMREKRKSDSKILIIDDDPDMMSFMRDYLGESFQVLTASDGREGLLKSKELLPDLIISDIMMPHMDGIELSEHLKSDILTSHIPIILLTSRSEVEDYLVGLDVGALDYIAKPFDIKILEAKVFNHIKNQESLKRLYASNQLDDLRNVKKIKVRDQFLIKVINTIENNLDNHQFGVKELAQELCISRSLLHKKLISAVEQSGNSFINSIRLKKAALLLLEGDQKISEIAFEVGFNDPKYFSKIFKKHFGTTPTEFVETNITYN